MSTRELIEITMLQSIFRRFSQAGRETLKLFPNRIGIPLELVTKLNQARFQVLKLAPPPMLSYRL